MSDDFYLEPMVLVGDEAMTPAEYTRYRAQRDRQNAWARERYATDPEYRARRLAAFKAWKEANRDHWRAYSRERMRRVRAAQKERG